MTFLFCYSPFVEIPHPVDPFWHRWDLWLPSWSRRAGGTWRIIPGIERWLGSPPFTSHEWPFAARDRITRSPNSGKKWVIFATFSLGAHPPFVCPGPIPYLVGKWGDWIRECPPSSCPERFRFRNEWVSCPGEFFTFFFCCNFLTFPY